MLNSHFSATVLSSVEKHESYTLGLNNKTLYGHFFWSHITVILYPERQGLICFELFFYPTTTSSRWFSYNCMIFIWFISIIVSTCHSLEYFAESQTILMPSQASCISVQNQKLTNQKGGNEVGICLWRHYSDLGPDQVVR